MTGREQLNRRKRWLGGGVLAGIVLLIAGIAVMPALGGAAGAAAAVPGLVALMAAALAGQSFALRCPWCRANLGRLLMHSGFLRIDPKLRYCPYCGADFDDEPDAGPAWDDPVE